MSPLRMSRDDAIALARSVGDRVAISGGHPYPANVVGIVTGVDILGRVHLTDSSAPVKNLAIPMADIRSWSLVAKGDAR